MPIERIKNADKMHCNIMINIINSTKTHQFTLAPKLLLGSIFLKAPLLHGGEAELQPLHPQAELGDEVKN